MGVKPHCDLIGHVHILGIGTKLVSQCTQTIISLCNVNCLEHDIQIIGSVPRIEERPIISNLVEKLVNLYCPVPHIEEQAKKLDFVHQTFSFTE